MASYHCAVKTGGKGRAGPHAEYISREGKYAPENTRGKSRMEDMEFTTSGNMPAWAEHDASIFWRAADEYERANGATYREIELALPRELNPEQRRALVEDFIQQQIGDRHPFTYAIHIPQAAIAGGEQPHAHIMYSERTLDGIARDPDLFFKRANSKNPEKGGCKKDSAGTKERLLETRERWATVQNQHLEKHGHPDRVDHRSLRERGIDRQPERHLGPLAVRQMERFDVSALLARRAAEGELERSNAELKTIDISGDLRAALADRAAEEIQTRQQQKERDDLRAATFERISANFRAASGAGAATSSAIGGSTANLSHAGALVRTAGGDLGGAVAGAERRILRSHADNCAPAVKRNYAIASDLIQQVADRFRDVVRAITAAQIAIAGRAVAARQAAQRPAYQPAPATWQPTVHLTALQRLEQSMAAKKSEQQPEAKPAPQPQQQPAPAPVVPKPKPQQQPADPLACLTADQREAVALTAALIERAARGDLEAIEQLPEQLDELDEHVYDARPGSGPPRREYDPRAAIAAAAAKRQDEARREVNRQAVARGITHAVPYPDGTSGLFTAEHYSSFETARKKAERDLEYKRYHDPRPDKGMFGNTAKQDKWDADHAQLVATAKHAAEAIEWRDAAIKTVTQGLETRDSTQIAEHAQLINDLNAKDALAQQQRLQRHTVLTAERERLNAKVKQQLPEVAAAHARGRGAGLGR